MGWKQDVSLSIFDNLPTDSIKVSVKWSSHIGTHVTYICTKESQQIKALKRLTKILNKRIHGIKNKYLLRFQVLYCHPDVLCANYEKKQGQGLRCVFIDDNSYNVDL